ncbi:MAG: hypothetical protein KDD34_05390, partial [Bdellovibrionales bacterium]|nr:hypothetical protein [Bdellovibrionales bacterium]
MKIILSMVALLSASAFACPEFNGTYTCTSEGQSGQMEIKTYQENGIYVYETDGDKLYADGQERPVQEEDLVGTMSATCSGSSLVMNLQGDYLENGQKAGVLTMTSTVTATDAG